MVQAVSAALAVAEAAEATTRNTQPPGTSAGEGATAAAAAAAAQHGPEGFPRALAALRLTRLFVARMVSTLDASQLRAQFYSRGRRRNGAGGGALVGGGAITEGQEEAAAAEGAGGNKRGAAAAADPVTALLASIMALLCAAEGEEDGAVGQEGRRGAGGSRRGGGDGVLSVEGFSDLQLEGVGLLLVLLGTQAYGPPPSLSPRETNGGELQGTGSGGVKGGMVNAWTGLTDLTEHAMDPTFRAWRVLVKCVQGDDLEEKEGACPSLLVSYYFVI